MAHLNDNEILVIGGADVRRAISMKECIEIIGRTMRSVSENRALLPLRTVVLLPEAGNAFGCMPGYLDEPRVLGAKLVAVYPANSQRGLPSHAGVVTVFDVETGRLAAIIDATEVTAIRTAAASAVATAALARKDATDLAILGTGKQAREHLQAMAEVRPLRRIRVWGRSPANVKRFVAEGERLQDIRIDVAHTVREAVQGAEIVCTTTSSDEPVLRGEWLAAGVHVNLVGASVATAREADDEVVRRARFFVDFRASALAQAGELRHAMEVGLVDEGHILGEIGQVLNGTVPGRTAADQITVYKSLGIAAQDLATAHAICARATQESLGSRVSF